MNNNGTQRVTKSESIHEKNDLFLVMKVWLEKASKNSTTWFRLDCYRTTEPDFVWDFHFLVQVGVSKPNCFAREREKARTCIPKFTLHVRWKLRKLRILKVEAKLTDLIIFKMVKIWSKFCLTCRWIYQVSITK